MKLKYYMRGLGIGIILTTLILTIGNKNEKLSDQEIMKRANELGMVTKEESDNNLDEVLEVIMSTQAPSPSPSVTQAAEPTLGPTPKPTIQPSPEPTKAATLEPTKAPAPEPTPTSIPIDKVGGQENNKSTEVTFVINGGMSSGQVAAMLVDKGLIDDADDFNKYIVKVGKASVIRVGTYKVPNDASYEDILMKITTK